MPRALAAAVVLMALLGAVGAAGYALSDDALDMVRRAPEAGAKVRDAVRRLRREQVSGAVADVARLANEVEKSAEAAAPRLRRPRASPASRSRRSRSTCGASSGAARWAWPAW
jgi:hypothetical protein